MRRYILCFIIYVLLTSCQAVNAQSSPSWYKSQIGTGIGNCGPASAAMMIEWSTGKKVTVQEIRKKIGMPIADGSTSFDMLIKVMKTYNVKMIYRQIRGLEDLKTSIIGYQAMAIVCLGTENISMGTSDKPYGRIYDVQVGHYIILDDICADYFIVQDPLNSPNRLYKIDEVWTGMQKDGSFILLIYKN